MIGRLRTLAFTVACAALAAMPAKASEEIWRFPGRFTLPPSGKRGGK